MSLSSAAEVLEKCKAQMGEELGEAFHFCRQQLFELSSVWDQHETLFQNKDRVDVLNKSGGLLSYNIQRLFYRHVLLGLLRLLDPEITMGRKNLVLKLLLGLANEQCRKSAEEIFSLLKKNTSELVEARNKILAHNDYYVATGQIIELNFGSRLLITNSLRAILSFLNIFEHEYLKSKTIIVPLGNSSAIQHLYYLELGLRFQTKIDSEVKAGLLNYKEFRQHPDWLTLGKNEEDRYM